jgi:hypothetical protein
MQPTYQPPSGHPNGLQAHRAAFAETIAPPSPKRQPAKWAAVMPYFVAVTALGVSVAVLLLVMTWRTSMQDQVNQLRHEVAATQSQLASDAASGGSQLSRLGQILRGVRGDVNTLENSLAAYTGACSTDATGPTGHLAVYVVPCHP